jgi:hypothetical protein
VEFFWLIIPLFRWSEALTLLEAAIQTTSYGSWSEALLPEEILKYVLWILENTLNLSLFEKACT